MCQIMEDIREEGREEGDRNRALKTAKTMLELEKYSLAETALISGISVEEVKQLAEQTGVVLN